MRLLLDTHAFLWFISGSPDLSETARRLIEDVENERLLSIASLWEISIKVSLGRLNLRMPFVELVEREVEGNAIKLLNITPAHLDELSRLPFHHKDPFDRLIIAQALVENSALLSKDTALEAYSVHLAW